MLAPSLTLMATVENPTPNTMTAGFPFWWM
jgi:hypothetical protein